MAAPKINIISINLPSGANTFSSGYCSIEIHPDGVSRVGKVNLKDKKTPKSIWVVPIPKGFSDIFENEWNPMEMGPLRQSLGNMGVEYYKTGSTGIDMNKLKDIGANAAVAAAGSLGLQGAIDAASVITGLTVNPYTQLAYKSPALRQFQFSWTFVPISSDEATLIKKFIAEIRKYSYPDISSLPGKFLEYPAEFVISIQAKNGNILLKTGASVCTSMQINYDTGGAPYLHPDGNPVSTTVTLSIQEAYILDRSSIVDMYENGGMGKMAGAQAMQDQKDATEKADKAAEAAKTSASTKANQQNGR